MTLRYRPINYRHHRSVTLEVAPGDILEISAQAVYIVLRYQPVVIYIRIQPDLAVYSSVEILDYLLHYVHVFKVPDTFSAAQIKLGREIIIHKSNISRIHLTVIVHVRFLYGFDIIPK